MSETESQSDPTPIEIHNRVVRETELQFIRLLGSSFVLRPEYFMELDSDNLKRSFNSKFVNTFYDREISCAGTQIEWIVSVKLRNRVLLSVKCQYIVSYEKLPDVEEEYCISLVRKLSRFSTYPYFRAMVARYSDEASAELPVLPVLK